MNRAGKRFQSAAGVRLPGTANFTLFRISFQILCQKNIDEKQARVHHALNIIKNQ